METVKREYGEIHTIDNAVNLRNYIRRIVNRDTRVLWQEKDDVVSEILVRLMSHEKKEMSLPYIKTAIYRWLNRYFGRIIKGDLRSPQIALSTTEDISEITNSTELSYDPEPFEEDMNQIRRIAGDDLVDKALDTFVEKEGESRQSRYNKRRRIIRRIRHKMEDYGWKFKGEVRGNVYGE